MRADIGFTQVVLLCACELCVRVVSSSIFYLFFYYFVDFLLLLVVLFWFLCHCVCYVMHADIVCAQACVRACIVLCCCAHVNCVCEWRVHSIFFCSFFLFYHFLFVSDCVSVMRAGITCAQACVVLCCVVLLCACELCV